MNARLQIRLRLLQLDQDHAFNPLNKQFELIGLGPDYFFDGSPYSNGIQLILTRGFYRGVPLRENQDFVIFLP